MAVKIDLSTPERDNASAVLPIFTHEDVAQGLARNIIHNVKQTRIVDLGDDWALVEVTMKTGANAYRQARVYRRTASGWRHEAPTAALWGKPNTIETTYFVFHYYADDHLAVSAAAAKLDALYPIIAAGYLPGQSSGAKREILVSPEESPQQPARTVATRSPGNMPLVVSSPSVNLTPVEMSDGDLLAESVILGLLDQFTEEAVQRNIPDRLHHTQAEVQLHALLQSVQLWQAWSLDLPLAALRKPIVQWLYSDAGPGKRVMPHFNAQWCDLHHLWKEAPIMLQAPLFCGEPSQGDPYQIWRFFYVSPWRMSDRSIFTPPTPLEPSGDPAMVVGLATVLEYAASTYGPQCIATLIANTPNNSSWERLIPATFGVPLVDFEKGWRRYLAEQYDVTLIDMR